MARSAHHVRRSTALSPEAVSRPGRPWRAVVLRDLRYSAQGLRSAAPEGRRPLPRQVRRSVAVYCVACSGTHDKDVAQLAYREERRARQLLRRQLGLIRAGPASDFALEPGRHRHSARWLA